MNMERRTKEERQRTNIKTKGSRLGYINRPTSWRGWTNVSRRRLLDDTNGCMKHDAKTLAVRRA